MNSLEEIAIEVAQKMDDVFLRNVPADVLRSYARRLVAALGAQEPVYVIFDGEPGNEGPRFVEVETANQNSVRAGEWSDYPLNKHLARLGPFFAAPVLPSVKEGWMPIETAPKGELIAIWIARTNKFGEKWSETVGECWLYCYHDSICGEWRTTRPSGHLRCVPERFVTHWMRNPAAPSPQEDKT